MKIFKYIGCAIQGHNWVAKKRVIEERRESTYRYGIGIDSPTYQGMPYFFEDEYLIWRCSYCGKTVKALLHVRPNNTRRRKFEAIKKKETWSKLFKALKTEWRK